MRNYLNRMRKPLLLISVITLLFFQTGCWDFTELDDNGYIVMLGIDKAEKNQLKVTYALANPQVGTSLMGQVTQNEKANNIMSFDVPDVIASRDLANEFVSRRIVFSHLRMVVIGEELARSKELSNYLLSMSRDGKVRDNVYIMVSKEPAAEFIRNLKPPMETRMHKFITASSLIWKKTGLVPLSVYKDYCQHALEPSDSQLMIYGTTRVRKDESKKISTLNKAGEVAKEGGDPAELLGAAVFTNEGRMVGTLAGNEVRSAMFLREYSKVTDINRSFRDIDNKDRFMSVHLVKDSTKIKVKIHPEYPEIDVKVTASAHLISQLGAMKLANTQHDKERIGNYIERELLKEANELVNKAKEKYGDIFEYNIIARGKFLTWQDWLDYKWQDKFKKAKVNVTYDVHIEDYGEIIAPLQGVSRE